MIEVAIACLPIFFTGHRISRWEGWLFVGYCAAYLAYLIASHDHPATAGLLRTVMLGLVIPLTALTLAVVTWREWCARRSGR